MYVTLLCTVHGNLLLSIIYSLFKMCSFVRVVADSSGQTRNEPQTLKMIGNEFPIRSCAEKYYDIKGLNVGQI